MSKRAVIAFALAAFVGTSAAAAQMSAMEAPPEKPAPAAKPAPKPAPAAKPVAAAKPAPAATTAKKVTTKTKTGKTVTYDCSKKGNAGKAACKK
ncbi:MAG: hypothetical protein A4S12_10425 [Proteobacteria bacterium SG_bin5]|nr:MAG: hypothetical protein A4S12_10425 [Proteobacteria bacterium SG_bin5]